MPESIIIRCAQDGHLARLLLISPCYNEIGAAIRPAATVCGHGDELGTLEKGKLADLVVVDGNPLDDLNGMDTVSIIVKDGELVLSPQQDSG